MKPTRGVSTNGTPAAGGWRNERAAGTVLPSMEDYVATQPAAERSRRPQKSRLQGPSRTIATIDSPDPALRCEFEAARTVEQFVAGCPQAGRWPRDEIAPVTVRGRV